MIWIVIIAGMVAGLLLVGVVYQWFGARQSLRQFEAPGALVDIGGRRLHLRCHGAGTPAVVFDAGIAASSVSWSRVQPEVAQFTRSCSYDRAGLAWSDPGARGRSISGFVEELRVLLERADIPPPYVLVGHSFGGMIVRAFARAYPTQIAGLVFVDTLHPEEWLNLSVEQRRMIRGGVFLSEVGGALAHVGVVRLCLTLLSRGAPGVPRRLSRLFGPTAAALLEHLVGEVQKLPAELWPAVQAHWSHPRAFRGMAQHLAALPQCSGEMSRETDMFGDLPVVVLSAAKRRPQWLAADAALARGSTQGRHIVSTRAGHWIQLDDPSFVVDAVRQVVTLARERGRRAS